MFEMPPQPGTKKMSIYIAPSWPEHDEPTVHFDFYKGDDSSWKVYWELSSMKESIQKKVEKAIVKQQDVKEALDDPGFGVAIQNDSIICSHEVEEEIRTILEEVCQKGLPDYIRTSWGLDGVSYKFVIDGFPATYRFWMRLPAAWSIMKKVIDACVDYAKINKNVYRCGVDRSGALTEREKQFLELRFGLSDGKVRTLPPYQREQLFRVVGSSSMVFTKKGLSMLTPYPEDPVNHQDGTGMAVKEMRTRLGLTQEELSLKIGIPEEIIREWELGKQEPPEHLIQLMEQLVRMKENGEPDSCLRYHVSADIYLSPSMMDVLYERGVILRERDVTADVVESELEKYIGAFAEVQSIRVDEIRTPGYRPEEYYGVDIAEAMAACPEMAQKLEKGEISALDLKAAYKKMMKKTDKTG